MKNDKLISVVIPTYNRANDLLIAIKSALEQTYPILEILVCDDGSTDNSKELVSQLHNPIVKWIDCGKNGGPAIPRNIGIKNSKGNWIAFLDSDDVWISTKLEKQIIAIEQHNVKAACSNASRIRFGEDKGTFSDYKKSTATLKDLMLNNLIICSTVLVNKQLLLNISLFPEEKKFIAIEDYALWLRVSTQTDFAFVNENLIRYIDNVETSIRTNYSDSWVIFDIIFSDFKNWVKEKNIRLTAEQKSEFKKLLKKIRNKGIPTASDNFLRKLSDKLSIKTRYNS